MTWRSFPRFSQEDRVVNIFIGNMAFSATEEDLRQLFEQYGTVEKVQIITDRDTGRARGFGFVEMPDSREARSDGHPTGWPFVFSLPVLALFLPEPVQCGGNGGLPQPLLHLLSLCLQACSATMGESIPLLRITG
jgi:hypothetical protein